jgi:outer membrane protein
MIRNLSLAAWALSCAATAAHAQSAAAPESSVFDGDYLMVGAGVIHGPSYEGSDDQVASAIPYVQGKLGGVEITPRPGGIALDLLHDGERPRLGFSLGPVMTFSRNRHSQIHDRVVRSAGRLKSALDVGGNAGVTVYRLLNPYDSLTVSADVKWNANDAHGGVIIAPGISYVTPLSRAAIVSIGISAKHVDDDYARYYYGVTPAQAAASGLPQFAAKGGWASLGVNALAGYDLDGNVLNGGFALFAITSYSRLIEDARQTPWTAIRGRPGQWLMGAGVGYTF